MEYAFAGKFGERDRRSEPTLRNLIEFLTQRRGMAYADALDAGWAWSLREMIEDGHAEKMKKKLNQKLMMSKLRKMARSGERKK